MRELNRSEGLDVAGAISTSDILHFFRNLGRSEPTTGTPFELHEPGNGAGMGEVFGTAMMLGAAAAIVGGIGLYTYLRKK
jgi:hypothetical protein